MKLYVFPPAPNAAKVLLYLAEKAAAGYEVQLERVPVNLLEGGQKDPEYLALNPFGTVPTLVTDQGTVLHESLAIIGYLEELFPEPSLWGKDPESRAVARQIERICDQGGLTNIARIVHTTKSPLGLPARPELATYFRERMPPSFEFLESLLVDGRPYLAGVDVTVGDCTLASGLQFARFAKLDVLEAYPALREWDARYRTRESASSVLVM